MAHDWLIELGHSRLKWVRSGPRGLVGDPGVADLAGAGEAAREIARDPGGGVWLAAVPEPQVVERLTGVLDSAGLDWTRILTGGVDLPLKPAYPGLGVDRWLAIQWPWQEYGSAFCLVDCGSALTVDLVDDRGRHRGGWIMPGLRAARRGLLDAAPGLTRPHPPPADARQPAADTADGIERGLLLQQAGSIRACAAAGAHALGRDLPLILTGGDALALESLVDAHRVEPHLVLRGLAMAAHAVK